MSSTLLLISISWMHVFTDGTNPIRIVLFALYLLALFAVLKFSHTRSLIKKRTLQILAVGSVLMLFTVGLIGHVWIYNAHDIPERSLAVFFDQDEITNTRLTHNHAGKSAIATLVTPVSSYFVSQADTGAGIASFFGPLFSIVLAFMFLVAVAAPLMLARYSMSTVSDRGKRIASFILYGIVAFIVLEKSVDGGILNDGTVIALAAYLALIMFPVRHFLRTVSVGAIVFFVIACVLLATGQYWGGDHYAFSALANATVLLLLILALHTARIEGWRSLRTGMIVLIALSSLAGKAFLDVRDKVAYLDRVAYADTSYVAAYQSEAVADTETIGVIGRLEVFTVRNEPAMTIGEVIDVLKLPYWYQPVSAYSGSCAQPLTRLEATFVVHAADAPKELSLTAGNLATLTLIPNGMDVTGWHIYSGSLSMHPCVPRRWDVLREMLREAGIDQAIVHSYRLTQIPIDRDEEGMWTSKRRDTAPID